MIRAIIFDLDNCLAAADEIGSQHYRAAFEAIRAAHRGTHSEAALQHAFSDCLRHPLDWVAARHGFTDEMRRAAWEVFATMEVEHPMYGYGDLSALAALPVQRFLVTSGFRRLQESKIRALGAASLFTAVAVDAIDEPGRTGKRGLFERILEAHHLRPEEVLVVGDNPDAEIEAGNQLGLRTVQILRPGVPRGDNATYYIETLHELEALLAVS